LVAESARLDSDVPMTTAAELPQDPVASDNRGPDELGHTHADVSGGWLRAATFGAMDGLVTNVSLVAGIGAAGVSPDIVVTAGLAGLVAGAFSMALGEYASVSTQNEAVDKEVFVEGREIRDNPRAEMAELAQMFASMGMSRTTATAAAREVHRDHDLAVRVHVSQELGVDPQEKASPLLAAVSSFVMFSVGAIVPLLPYLLGFTSLVAGLTVGAAGLLLAGAMASAFTATSWWWGAVRQLLFGALAAGATYAVGSLLGVTLT
jgi:VIT1/CCC1 family predicted Fe2+/Mn2+ transporter